MLVAVDIGNTNIVIALHDGRDFIDSFRVYTDQRKTGDEYLVIFRTLMESVGMDPSLVDGVVVSSVVPNLSRSIQKVLRRLFPAEPLIVDHGVESGLERESIPSELGSDLLCNLAYAHHEFPDDVVTVVDFGTALTLSTVDEGGNVLGVSIAPGLITAVNSLFGSTAQLPQVELKIPDRALGRNSEESIRSGIMLGYAGLVESMIRRIEDEVGRSVKVIATGGLSKTISPLIERIDRVDGFHTLRGLVLISELNSR